MPSFSVSVVIPHYGDPEAPLALLAQLARQTAPATEIIVADDCSPTPFELPPGFLSGSAPVTVVRRERNGGFGAACNTGAAAATGDLLLFLNSDLTIADDFLANFLDAAAPWMPAVAGPRITSPDGHDAWSARHFPTPLHNTVEWLTPLVRWRDTSLLHEGVGHDTRAASATTATPTDWLVGAVLLLPRKDFLAVGGFDERYHMNSEEVDLQRQLAERGLPRVYLPGVSVEHIGGGSSDAERRIDWVVTSRLRYFDKWGGLNRMRVGMTAATLVNGSLDAARKLAGRNVTPLATTRNHLALIWKDFS